MSQDGRRYHYQHDIPGRVPQTDHTSPDLRELAEAVSQNSDLINAMNAQLQQLIQEIRMRDEALYKSQQEQLNHMTKQLAETQAELAFVRGKLDIVKTYTSAIQTALDPPTTRNVRQKVHAQQPSPKDNQVVHQDSDPPLQPEKKPSCKGKRISQLLVDFYNEDRLSEDQWKNVRVPLNYPEGNLVRKSLELCQYVMTEDELLSFRTRTLSDEEELKTISAAIEQRAFRKMWDFEGMEDIDLKEDANKKLGSRGQQPTYGAVGARVREYKKYLAKLSGNLNPDKELLRERLPEEAFEGNHMSINLFNG